MPTPAAWLCRSLVAGLLLAGCGGAGATSPSPRPEPSEPRSGQVRDASVKIVGNTFVGVRYTKELSLTRAANGYRLEFTCEGQCACTRIAARVPADLVEGLASRIAALRDEGEAGRCCDRPWTEIRLVFQDGDALELIVGEEPIRLEELFDLTC